MTDSPHLIPPSKPADYIGAGQCASNHDASHHNSQSFFTAGPEAAALSTASIPTTSALEQLGPSPFPKSGFPLLGFLESVYDHLATHAAHRLP